MVLDTETTGLSFRDCELIEIAAARLSGREVVERFRTFVHPGQPIPKVIQELTGITDLDVAEAPSPSEAVSQLADFVGGSPVLAHNATFDRTFIRKVPGGKDVSDFWIDTLALSRIALPRLRSHRLADMARAFHCEGVTHRAMQDVDALSGMWRILLCALEQLPPGLPAALAGMHPEVEWSFRPVFSYLSRDTDHEAPPFDLRSTRHELVHEDKVSPRRDAVEHKEPLTAPSEEEISGCFEEGGPVAQMYQRYERRPGQVRMALEVREAFSQSHDAAIEAGTGLGKSVAYLVPAILYAQRNEVTVGVATKTNALTDQLIEQELPALAKVLPKGARFYCLKGYEHYPCLLKVDRAAADDGLPEQVEASTDTMAVTSDLMNALAVVYAYASQSPEGDLDTLGIRWKTVPRELLTTTSSDCIRTRCPYYPNECFVHGARRRAASGDIVVTNHSLLLRDIALDNAILPPIRHWIVDEAHTFESEARRQWALEVSSEAFQAVYEIIGGSRNGLIHTIMSKAAGDEAATLVVGLLAKVASAVSGCVAASSDFFATVHDLLPLAGKAGDYDLVTLWIDGDVRASAPWKRLAEQGTRLGRHLDDCVQFIGDVIDVLSDDTYVGQLQETKRRFEWLCQGVNTIVSGEDTSYVYSARLARQRRRIGKERLIAEKLDIGAELGERWLPEMQSVIFTSATMSIGDNFDHFDHAVGLDMLGRESYHNVRLASGYDFDENMAIIVPKDLPQPNERGYLDKLAELLLEVHVSMDGSVLTLFTNRREMERVYSKLSPELAKQGLNLICQERNSSPRRLADRFISDKRLSLFALRSFWEGFDATGDTLRCVVVAKLPFASPRDPLVLERGKREARSWWRYSLPEAIISVKQAAGRLIRSNDDVGVVILADSRVAHKQYGRSLLEAMPSHNSIMLDTSNVGRYITVWRRSRER